MTCHQEEAKPLINSMCTSVSIRLSSYPHAISCTSSKNTISWYNRKHTRKQSKYIWEQSKLSSVIIFFLKWVRVGQLFQILHHIFVSSPVTARSSFHFMHYFIPSHFCRTRDQFNWKTQSYHKSINFSRPASFLTSLLIWLQKNWSCAFQKGNWGPQFLILACGSGKVI